MDWVKAAQAKLAEVSGGDKNEKMEVATTKEAEAEPKASAIFDFFGGKKPEPEAKPVETAEKPQGLQQMWTNMMGGGDEAKDVEAGDGAEAKPQGFWGALSGGADGEVAPESQSMLPSFMGGGANSNSSQLSMSMMSGTRFKMFVACLLLALFFMGLGSMFLPMVVLRPHKFAFCFTMGSLLFMGSFAALKVRSTRFRFTRCLSVPHFFVYFSCFSLKRRGRVHIANPLSNQMFSRAQHYISSQWRSHYIQR
jgi:hypothetical protein